MENFNNKAENISVKEYLKLVHKINSSLKHQKKIGAFNQNRAFTQTFIKAAPHSAASKMLTAENLVSRDVRGLNQQQITARYNVLKKYQKMKSSTVAGQRDILRKKVNTTNENLGAVEGGELTESAYKAFWEAVTTAKSKGFIFNSDDYDVMLAELKAVGYTQVGEEEVGVKGLFNDAEYEVRLAEAHEKYHEVKRVKLEKQLGYDRESFSEEYRKISQPFYDMGLLF